MRLTQLACGAIVFLAAFLLFAVEPMAAKALLPLLGGSSAVWVTCLVFFQGMLLAGYLYAHWMTRGRPRLWLHLTLLAASVALLTVVPVALGSLGIDVHLNATASDHPVLTIFLALGATIGLPFLVLGSTSPMVQVWVARMAGGAIPYRLFALSNVGSLLALILYPTVIEPRLTLAAQRAVWALGFVLYALACAWLARRAQSAPPVPTPTGETTPQSPHEPWRGKALCFLLPMAATMQLCAVTSHLSQDVAAIPLLWVLPLGVYLVTFILAFEAPGLYRRFVVVRLLAVMLGSLGYALSKVDTTLPIRLAIAFYLLEIFIACWFCHAEAYRLRPLDPRHTTSFYLLVSAGGVTGTFLVAIASPLLFRANYDLALSFLVTAALAAAVTWEDGWAQRLLWVTGSALLLALAVMLHIGFGRHTLMRARNFYGSLRVTQAEIDTGEGTGGLTSNQTGPIRTLMNGRIRHGTQMLETSRRHTPTTYYAPDSGVGIALENCCQTPVGTPRPKSVGVIGLGVGTLAAYGQPGDRIRFYEINPLVEPIARNLFTYIADSPAAISIISGDGRASLSRETPQNFDILVIDAFSGDAIPLHLLTHEAMQVYRHHLVPGGILAFHVSNSYLDLAPEIRRLADSVSMQARAFESLPIPDQGAYRSTWVLVTADPAFFTRPAVAAAITPIPEQPGLRLWTDDYSSLLPVLGKH
jgi:hypothetical protein